MKQNQLWNEIDIKKQFLFETFSAAQSIEGEESGKQFEWKCKRRKKMQKNEKKEFHRLLNYI